MENVAGRSDPLPFETLKGNRCQEGGLTCCQLADCVEELELPALLHVVDGLCDLIAWRLDVELQAKPVDIPITCAGVCLSCK